jgi:hypothetical protein
MSFTPAFDRSAHPETDATPNNDVRAAVELRINGQDLRNLERLARDIPLQSAHAATGLQGERVLFAKQQALTHAWNATEHDDACVSRSANKQAARSAVSLKQAARAAHRN